MYRFNAPTTTADADVPSAFAFATAAFQTSSGILTATNPDVGPLTWAWVAGWAITACMFFGTIAAAWLLARWQDRVDEAAANRLRVVRDDERTRP